MGTRTVGVPFRRLQCREHRHRPASTAKRRRLYNPLRPVGPDHTFADAEQTVYAADGEVLLALHVVNLLCREGDDWRLVDSRPYAFPPLPG